MKVKMLIGIFTLGLMAVLLCSVIVYNQSVEAKGDTVNMKVRLDCINSLTGKYQASVTLKSHWDAKKHMNIDLKHGEKQSKKLDFNKILAKDDDDFNTYTVTFKFKNVKEGDNFQAESKSLDHNYRFRESITYFQPGNYPPPNTILFKVDTHTCQGIS